MESWKLTRTSLRQTRSSFHSVQMSHCEAKKLKKRRKKKETLVRQFFWSATSAVLVNFSGQFHSLRTQSGGKLVEPLSDLISALDRTI